MKAKDVAVLEGEAERSKQLNELEQQLESELANVATDVGKLACIVETLAQQLDELRPRLMSADKTEGGVRRITEVELRELEAVLGMRIAVFAPPASASTTGMRESPSAVFAEAAAAAAD